MNSMTNGYMKWYYGQILTSSGFTPSCFALNPTIEKITILENIEVKELVKQTTNVSTKALLLGLL